MDNKNCWSTYIFTGMIVLLTMLMYSIAIALVLPELRPDAEPYVDLAHYSPLCDACEIYGGTEISPHPEACRQCPRALLMQLMTTPMA